MTAPAVRGAVPRGEVASAAGMSGAERAAVVLSLLEPDAARALASGWSQIEVDRVVAAYEALGPLPKPVVLEIVASFVAAVGDRFPAVRGGHRSASRLADTIMPPGEASAPAIESADILPPDAPPGAVWTHLAAMPAGSLARLVAEERVSVVATLCARLGADRGAALLTALPQTVAVAVVRHLAGGRLPDGGTVDAVAEALRDRAAASEDRPAVSDPAEPLAALLTRCPRTRQREVLGPLRSSDPGTAERIEDGLVTYEDLATRLPRTAVPFLFREVDQDLLDTALRYGAEAAADATAYLYSNVSQRLAEQIRDRVAARPMPSRDDGEAAQAAIVGIVMVWAAEGRFALRDAAEAPGG